MKRVFLLLVLSLMLTLVLAAPAFAQTSLPNPPFDGGMCQALQDRGVPVNWTPPTGPCVVSPPHR